MTDASPGEGGRCVRSVVLGSLHLCAVVQSLSLDCAFIYQRYLSPGFSLVFMINRIKKKEYKRRFRLTDASHLKHLPGGDSRGPH